MKKAAKDLIGTHDFAAFVSNEDKKEDNVRTIYKIDFTLKDGIEEILVNEIPEVRQVLAVDE